MGLLGKMHLFVAFVTVEINNSENISDLHMGPGPHAVDEGAVRRDGRVEVHRGHHHALAP